MDTRNVSFEDFFKSQPNPDRSIADEVIVYDGEQLTSKHVLNPETMPPLRFDFAFFILCTYGEITIGVDYTTYRLTKGSILGLNISNIISNIHIRNNCEGFVIAISQNLAMSLLRDTPVIKKMIKNMKGRFEPVIKLNDDEMRVLKEMILRIKNYLKKTDHAFQRQMVKNETGNFIMEFVNIYLQRSGGKTQPDEKESRNDEILRIFVHLVIEHFKEQHEVAYYADKMHMTPDHLARSVSAASGKSPLQWIGRALITEAMTLLRKPDATVKQVADELNFGDQSSFGKFFRKHTGMTPMKYKGKG